MNTKALKRLRWFMLAFWLVVLALTGPFNGKLEEVQDNDTLSWLPKSAESTEVVRLEERFKSGDEPIPAVVAYQRDSGITDEDRALAAAQRESLAARFGSPVESAPLIPSDDGKALIYTISVPDNEDTLLDDIESMREQVGEGSAGLDIKVTGPGGALYDNVSVFSGIDGKVLVATASVVTLLLLLIYRSPFLWLAPLFCVAAASGLAAWAVYVGAEHFGLTVNGQSGGILPILVFGAGTDYALLLISRYREELRRFESPVKAMRQALIGAGPAIIASGATVIAGLLCLLAADLSSTKGLGPIGALGITAAMFSMLTLLPAVLMLAGRRIFWPFVPHFGSETHETKGRWADLGRGLSRRPRIAWLSTLAFLITLGFGTQTLGTGLDFSEQFRGTTPDSVIGQQIIADHYTAGSSTPNTVVARSDVASKIEASPGVASVRPDGNADDLIRYSVVFDASPNSREEADAIHTLRDNLQGTGALVGGPGAQTVDSSDTSERDNKIVIPLVLAVVFLILVALLRALVAPVLLILTVIVSFVAALGISEILYKYVFDFAGLSEGVALLGFVFLVALGVDYNIFLVSRAREEAASHGTADGMRRALAVTGGVITSAGVVLAATFAVFIDFPLVALSQMGLLVAVGVLLDTLIVRSILVPALTFDIGKKIWWPNKLASENR